MKSGRSRHRLLAKTFILGMTLWSGLNCAADSIPKHLTTSAPKNADILQRALHYEWMLGAELAPEMAACVEAQVGAKWSLPISAETPPPERFVERVQRAHEHCSTVLASDQLDFDRRFIVQSLRNQLKEQNKAHRTLEGTKVAARTCIERNDDPMQFKRCMEQRAPAMLTELTWPRWLALFELFVQSRSATTAHTPD